MESEEEFKRKKKIRTVVVGTLLLVVYSVVFNVYIGFFMSCGGILVFAVLIIVLFVFFHFLFEDFRKSDGKYVYYPCLLYAILMLIWMVYNTLSRCG
ncbi:MAG: hypothetical protein HXS52_02580 [Theionarchaea archaeon]|nr:hypothetical protein [Theionarchaea archaeon]